MAIAATICNGPNHLSEKWLLLLEKELMKSYLVIAQDVANATTLKKRRLFKYVIIGSFVTVILHSLVILVTTWKHYDVEELPSVFRYNIYSCMPGYALVVYQILLILGCSVSAGCLVHSPGREVIKTLHHLSSDKSSYASLKTVMKWTIIVMQVAATCSQISTYFIVTCLWVVNFLTSKNPYFVALMTTPNLIILMFCAHFAIFALIQIPVLFLLSTILVGKHIEVVKQDLFSNRDITATLMKLNKCWIYMDFLNGLTKRVLRDMVYLFCPLITVATAIVFSPGFPLWFRAFMIGFILPIFLVIQVSLYRSGRLFTVSCSLLSRFYRLLTYDQERRYKKRHYEKLLHIRKAIKFVSSNRRPICFYFPNETLLTPLKSLSFTVEAVLDTLLFLTYRQLG
jgi:hypothetical protein